MALLAQHRLGSSLPLGLSGQALSSFPVAPRQCRRYVYPCRVANSVHKVSFRSASMEWKKCSSAAKLLSKHG